MLKQVTHLEPLKNLLSSRSGLVMFYYSRSAIDLRILPCNKSLAKRPHHSRMWRFSPFLLSTKLLSHWRPCLFIGLVAPTYLRVKKTRKRVDVSSSSSSLPQSPTQPGLAWVLGRELQPSLGPGLQLGPQTVQTYIKQKYPGSRHVFAYFPIVILVYNLYYIVRNV